MNLNDELEWMNLIRRVRYYLPSGQFFDSDFDATMGMKEIKKIIGLITSIKQPFSLLVDDFELPDTNKETLNSLFKDKPFDELIIAHIHINSEDNDNKFNKQEKINLMSNIKEKIKDKMNFNSNNINKKEKDFEIKNNSEDYINSSKLSDLNYQHSNSNDNKQKMLKNFAKLIKISLPQLNNQTSYQ